MNLRGMAIRIAVPYIFQTHVWLYFSFFFLFLFHGLLFGITVLLFHLAIEIIMTIVAIMMLFEFYFISFRCLLMLDILFFLFRMLIFLLALYI